MSKNPKGSPFYIFGTVTLFKNLLLKIFCGNFLRSRKGKFFFIICNQLEFHNARKVPSFTILSLRYSAVPGLLYLCIGVLGQYILINCNVGKCWYKCTIMIVYTKYTNLISISRPTVIKYPQLVNSRVKKIDSGKLVKLSMVINTVQEVYKRKWSIIMCFTHLTLTIFLMYLLSARNK